MDEKALRDLYAARGLEAAAADHAVAAVSGFESFLLERGDDLAHFPLNALKEYLARLVASGDNDLPGLLALARYCHLARRHEAYIHLAAVLGRAGLLENLAKRLEDIAGAEVRGRVFAGIAFPAEGAPADAAIETTIAVVDRLRAALPGPVVARVLAGNLHGIPTSAFAGERDRFLAAESIDAWLADRHARAVAELERHAAEGRIWFEQLITPAVVAYVRANPEVLGGVRQGDRILFTKIPYAPDAWLRETDPARKRCLACHCPLARESLRGPGTRVPSVFCNCSAGFEKVPFGAAFGVEPEVEVVESVLAGDDRCRFSIRIPGDYR